MKAFFILISILAFNINSMNGQNANLVTITNGQTKVVVDLEVGGRVVEYSLECKSVIHQYSKEDEHLASSFGPGGGRMDFGPERITPSRPETWTGSWELVSKSDLSIKIKSQVAKQCGVQLIREFVLDKESTHLAVTQYIVNVSNETKRYGHWSRTFGKEYGICLAPLNESSRFPVGYMTYPIQDHLNYKPEPNENCKIQDGVLIIKSGEKSAKYITDDNHGWLAYLTPDDQLFIKKFEVFEDKVYGEMTGATVSIWTSDNGICEVEPIGPWEIIKPGKQASFTENWYISSFNFPGYDQVKTDPIKEIIEKLD